MDKITLNLYMTSPGTIETYGNGQFIWQPYLANGTKDTQSIFRFGRSNNLSIQPPGPEDGLFMSRGNVYGYKHDVFLGNHPDVPNLHINSNKSTAVPFILCTGSDQNDPKFAVTGTGQIISEGVFSHDFSILPDSYYGSSVHDSFSVYVGGARLSYDTVAQRMDIHVLKEGVIPKILKDAPYNFTGAPPGTNRTVHEWMELARQSHSPDNFHIKVSDIFPNSNSALDWDKQQLRLVNNEQLRFTPYTGGVPNTDRQFIFGANTYPENHGIEFLDSATNEKLNIGIHQDEATISIMSKKTQIGGISETPTFIIERHGDSDTIFSVYDDGYTILGDETLVLSGKESAHSIEMFGPKQNDTLRFIDIKNPAPRWGE